MVANIFFSFILAPVRINSKATCTHHTDPFSNVSQQRPQVRSYFIEHQLACVFAVIANMNQTARMKCTQQIDQLGWTIDQYSACHRRCARAYAEIYLGGYGSKTGWWGWRFSKAKFQVLKFRICHLKLCLRYVTSRKNRTNSNRGPNILRCPRVLPAFFSGEHNAIEFVHGQVFPNRTAKGNCKPTSRRLLLNKLRTPLSPGKDY